MENSIIGRPHDPIPSSTSSFIKEIIEELLIKNPNDRPTTDQIMQKQKMQYYIQKVNSMVSKN